jgi:ferrous iron transport protein B
LPGIYSLSPYTMEELVSRKYLVEEKPDLIVNVVDASNLARNLYLTSQLLELGIPTIVALNMMDVVEKKGDKIDMEKMSKELGCRVVGVVASQKNGIKDLIGEILEAEKTSKQPKAFTYSNNLENLLEKIANIIGPVDDDKLKKYYAIKAFENDKDIIKSLKLNKDQINKIDALRKDYEIKEDDSAEGIVTTERYDTIEIYVDKFLVKAPEKETFTDKVDKIVTSRLLGLPIFAFVMWLVYYIAIAKVGTPLTDLANESLDGLQASIEAALLAGGVNEIVVGILVNGALKGAFAVLGFLPQMLTLFLLLSILEDIGYMARVAFVMDRVFRKFGLSGKSIIPIMIGTGCSVPGIQASRTIENDRDRKITIMTTSFMPCSAKLPVIALIAGSFFPEHSQTVTFSIYIIGIASVVVSGVILKKFKSLASKPAPFVMELPAYHIPRPSSVLKDVFDKGLAFARRAISIIAVSSVVLWVLGNFDPSFNLIEENGSESLLAIIGGILAPIFRPLGFGTWQASVATLTGFIAKENIVASLGVVLGLGKDIGGAGQDLVTAFNAALPGALAGYSFLLFNMLCMPCFAAVAAIKTEMNSNKWTLAAIGYLMGFAYVISLIFYNFAEWFVNGNFTFWTVIAIFALVGLLYLIFRKAHYQEEKSVYSKVMLKGLE